MRHLQGAAGPAIFAVASFLLMWPFARLDFDRHHDGYMLAQAMAVHQGASVHVDAFAQYGPVMPWLQSLALFLPLGPGMALRALNLALIAVTIFLLADMGRRSPRNWPVSRAVGWWAAISWVVLADVWLAIPMLPWSSTLAALLSVATLYLLTRALRDAEDGDTRAASMSGLAGGVLLGLLPFTRINVGLSAVAVCLVVAVLILVGERSSKRRLAALFVLGTVLSSLAVVLVLYWTDSLPDFYRQSISWPLTWGREATGTLHTQEILTITVIFQAIPVALVGVALLLQLRVGKDQSRWSVTRSGASLFTVLAGVIILSWQNFEIFSSVRGGSWELMISALYSYLTTPNLGISYLFMVILVVVAMVTCATQALTYIFRDRSSRRVTPWLLLGGLALSGLTQSVPTWDPRHGWWGAPIGLLLLFALVQKVSTLNRPTGNPLMLPLLGTLVMAVFSGAAHLGSERVEGERGSLIEGMRVSRQELTRISQDTTFLGQQLQGVKPVVYLVDDGDLSILDGRYRSADAYFVAWGGSPPVQTRIVNGNPLVVQRDVFADDEVSDLARSLKYRVVARNERLAVLMPGQG